MEFKLESPHKPKVKDIIANTTINYLDRLQQVNIINFSENLKIPFYLLMMRTMKKLLILIGQMNFNV
jgi:hypothetical protein